MNAGWLPVLADSICTAHIDSPWPASSRINCSVAAEAAVSGAAAWRDAWLNPPWPPSNVIDIAYQRMLRDRTLTNLYNGLVYYRETAKQGKFFDAAEFAKVTRNSVTRNDIVELDDIHTALDAAVLDAYGWPHNFSDEQILERLLVLNLERAAA